MSREEDEFLMSVIFFDDCTEPKETRSVSERKEAELVDIVSPGERFTLWLNCDGKPVAKPLAEMTAAEVLQTLYWRRDEVARLERIVAPYMKIATDLSLGIGFDITPMEQRKASAAKDGWIEAMENWSG